MNMNDMMNSAKSLVDDAKDKVSDSGETSGNGLSGLMDKAKDLNMDELAKYKDMSKEELIQELKNSEHTETVINFIKGLIDKK